MRRGVLTEKGAPFLLPEGHGTLFAVAGLAMFVDGITAYPSAPFNPMTGAAAALMVAVIRLAVKWPKRQG